MGEVYRLWGAAGRLLLGATQYIGWSMSSAAQGKTQNPAVRANPGAYRSPYYIPGRTMRGK